MRRAQRKNLLKRIKELQGNGMTNDGVATYFNKIAITTGRNQKWTGQKVAAFKSTNRFALGKDYKLIKTPRAIKGFSQPKTFGISGIKTILALNLTSETKLKVISELVG